MKNQILLALSATFLIAGSGFVACSGDDSTPVNNNGGDAGPNTNPDSGPNTNPDSGPNTNPDAGPGDSGPVVPPAPPTLGTQIDRMGRAAVNTALNHGFDGNAATAGAAKDAYNADKTVTGWVGAYAGQFEANLAILDSLDTGALPDGGGGCGNQPFVDNTIDGGAAYGTLASVLANDMIWLKTDALACTTGYLAVELNATNALPNNDCGGRQFSYDVIATTYSVAAGGVPLNSFGSGVSAVAAKTSGTTFPYFANPL